MAKRGKKKNEERKKEIERLKKRIEELEKEDNENKEVEEKEETKKPSENKKYAKILVVLIVLLLVIDVVSLIVYLKPDFSGIFKSKSSSNDTVSLKKCSDGTPYSTCSDNKPLYCYNGELVKKASVCRCPSGYKVDFQDCKKI